MSDKCKCLAYIILFIYLFSNHKSQEMSFVLLQAPSTNTDFKQVILTICICITLVYSSLGRDDLSIS